MAFAKKFYSILQQYLSIISIDFFKFLFAEFYFNSFNNRFYSKNLNKPKEEILFAERCLKASPYNPIYARVDIIFDNDSNPVISELELIEPELWFRFKEESAYKLAEIVKDFLNKLNC